MRLFSNSSLIKCMVFVIKIFFPNKGGEAMVPNMDR